MDTSHQIGFIHNQQMPDAIALVNFLIKGLGLVGDVWVRPAGDLEGFDSSNQGLNLLVTVGGDGTILRTAHFAAPRNIPILGINLGRVGFMTELAADDALEAIPSYLEGEVMVEERSMVQAYILRPDGEEPEASTPYHALNDVVVGSGGGSRMVALQVKIDGALLAVYHADGMIVATATGSTGYALSAGGPIIHPMSEEILLKPVATHLGLESALVLNRDSHIEISVQSPRPADLYIDGFVQQTLDEGTHVNVQASPYKTLFLRKYAPGHYYATLMKRLGLTAY